MYRKRILQIVSGLSLYSALAYGFLGCSSEPAPTKSSDPVSKSQPTLEVIRPKNSGLKKYAPKPKAPLPKLAGVAPKVTSAKAPPLKRITLKARLIGSIQARGGTAEDWTGFDPGERLFRATWTPAKQKDSEEQPKPLEVRIKVKSPDQGNQWLGRRVSIKGYWVRPPETALHTGKSSLPSPVELHRRKGQDLLDAVKEIQAQRLDALGDDQETKRQTPSVGGRGSAQARGARVTVPVFYAEEMTLKR